ncbi:MAG TPA: NAD(P)-binding domain-containing protein [Polyangiales bacterium]|nr:NAD(P)-binding domain-containing protein [Polyangiales bacterium]
MAKSNATADRNPNSSAQSAHGEQLLEEGAAFMRLHGLAPSAGTSASTSTGTSSRPSDRRTPLASVEPPLDVIVIGAGQAGLSVGYHLKQRGLRFVILDGHARVGDTWRRRWDSLRLFTPASLDGLDGMPFPARSDYFPTKDEMGDYLEAYAKRFALPVRCGVVVERVSKQNGRYLVKAGALELEAAHVVVAMASYQQPRVPAFAAELDPGIVQLHSSAYRNPAQLKPGALLIAGAGNSGSELAVELGRSHEVHMAGRDTGHVPFRMTSWLGRNVLCRLLLRIVFHRLLTVSTPMGRKARPQIISKGGPLIRVRPEALAAAGVARTARIAGVRDGRPLLEDGRALDVANVIWCTGFDPGSSFIDLPVFDEQGQPRHERGVVGEEPGFYFVGLAFLYAMSSTMVHGVGRDAAFIVKTIAARVAQQARA